MPSGSEVLLLRGPAMVGLVRAVAALTEASLSRYVVVGGVAVAARLGQAHRATADVDAVVDETTPPDAVEALLALPGVTADDPAAPQRVKVAGTKVEILHVGPLTDEDLADLPPQQALFVAAHTWALETATELTVISADDTTVQASAPFATPAALLAMKLHAVESRHAAAEHKRAADAFDIYRLLLDLDANGRVREALVLAPAPLRELVHDAARRVLIDQAARTRTWLRAGGDVTEGVTADELRYVGGILVQALK